MKQHLKPDPAALSPAPAERAFRYQARRPGPLPASPSLGGGPRERAASLGVGSLSDLELVQALLGSGGRNRPLRHLADDVLAALDSQPQGPDWQQLLDIPGMGLAKTTLVCAALELARRLWLPEHKRIRQPGDALALIRHYADRQQEIFLCLPLNGANEVIACTVVSVGLVNRTLVHPREIFAEAIAARAASLIVAHNHPSGCLEPSQDDRETTRRLKAAGELLGIALLDHVIFSTSAYWSFAEAGLL